MTAGCTSGKLAQCTAEGECKKCMKGHRKKKKNPVTTNSISYDCIATSWNLHRNNNNNTKANNYNTITFHPAWPLQHFHLRYVHVCSLVCWKCIICICQHCIEEQKAKKEIKKIITVTSRICAREDNGNALNDISGLRWRSIKGKQAGRQAFAYMLDNKHFSLLQHTHRLPNKHSCT